MHVKHGLRQRERQPIMGAERRYVDLTESDARQPCKRTILTTRSPHALLPRNDTKILPRVISTNADLADETAFTLGGGAFALVRVRQTSPLVHGGRISATMRSNHISRLRLQSPATGDPRAAEVLYLYAHLFEISARQIVVRRRLKHEQRAHRA
eukprot:6193542-Pleurochrysis_carterae.AAC.1